MRPRCLLLTLCIALAAGQNGSAIAADEAIPADPYRPAAIVTENVPVVPGDLIHRLRDYQNVRAARFCGWAPDGRGILVQTRFANADQLHRVYEPGGRREQVTFFDEPVDGRINPVNNAQRIRSALLVAHGRNDPRVPFSEAEQIAPIVRRNGVDVWAVYADSEGHGFRKRDNRDYLTAATVLFLQRHLLVEQP